MTTPASNFMNFVTWLNDSYIRYFIAWGYEQLPQQHSGGDVDICVSQQHYQFVSFELRSRGYVPTKCGRYSNMTPASTDTTHLHEHFAAPEQFTIDMFTTFCFAYEGQTTVLMIDPFSYEPARIQQGAFWTASPFIESLFTSLRVLGGRQDCVKRLIKFLG